MHKAAILAVDDEPRFCDFVERTLEPAYEVHCAASGMEALFILSQEGMDAAIIDAVMDEIEGSELVCMLRALSLRLPVIGVSARSDRPECKRLTGVVDRFLAKPVSAGGLRKEVRALLKESPPRQPAKRLPRIAKELAEDKNLRAYLVNKDDLVRDYLGQYVAFVDGQFFGADADASALIRRVYEKYGPRRALIQKVTPELEIVHLASPLKVRDL